MAMRGTTRSSSGASTPRGRASSTKRSAAAKKGGQARGRQQRARKAASGTAKAATKPARRAGVEAKTVAEFRDALRKNLIRPMDMVMITRERIEEVLDEAVERGAITTKDAQGIGSNLLKRGRKETNDVLKDLEGLLSASVARPAKEAAKGVRKQASGARRRAVRAADPALATADRARRAAGVGPNFPILGYDDLTATEVQRRLRDLTPAELRKVRDYERRHGNRKTILNGIEAKLK
jgi:polyhydroxyalkanoate synthesis regulator phasin